MSRTLGCRLTGRGFGQSRDDLGQSSIRVFEVVRGGAKTASIYSLGQAGLGRIWRDQGRSVLLGLDIWVILRHNKAIYAYGRVAELADAPDLGSGTARCAGSIPVTPTEKLYRTSLRVFDFIFELVLRLVDI